MGSRSAQKAVRPFVLCRWGRLRGIAAALTVPCGAVPVVHCHTASIPHQRHQGVCITQQVYTRDMEKKVVIVTGGEEGLGYEIVKALAPEHRVIIFGLKQDKLDTAAKELACEAIQCDVTDPDRVNEAVREVVGRYGRIDCLVNNAGIFAQGDIDDHSIDQIQSIFAVNTLGTIFMIKSVVVPMKQNHAGLIVNIISQSGLNPRPEWSIYAASKWAITGLTKSLAEELRSHGIRVTGIYPSRLKTQLFRNAGVDRDLSRALDPSEVARAIEFLLSLKPNTEITELGLRSIQMEV